MLASSALMMVPLFVTSESVCCTSVIQSQLSPQICHAGHAYVCTQICTYTLSSGIARLN